MKKIVDAEKAISLYNGGKTALEISKILGVKESTVGSFIYRNINKGLLRRRIEPIEDSKIARLYLDGMSTSEIHKKLNINFSTVEKHLDGIFGKDRKPSKRFKISNDDIVKLYNENVILKDMSKKLKTSRTCLNGRIKKLLSKNILVKRKRNFSSRRLNIPENKLRVLYIKKERSLRFIAKQYKTSGGAVKRELKRYNIPLNTSSGRYFLKKTGMRYKEYVWKHKLIFRDRLKRKRFAYCKGICEYCHKYISYNWKDACYHHKIPICKGGRATFKNCMVLHKECHYDPIIFKKLHGFPPHKKYLLESPTDYSKFTKNCL